MTVFPTLCDVNHLFIWAFFVHVRQYYREQKWVFLAPMNSGNFGVLVWASQQFCTAAWQNFIRGLMQLKYFSFKWTRKTHSQWVVKSGRGLHVHLWRMLVCLGVYELLRVTLCLSIVCDCCDLESFRSSQFQIVFQSICLLHSDYFPGPEQVLLWQIKIKNTTEGVKS